MENRQKNYGSVHDTKASMMYNRFLKQYNEWLSGGPIPDTGNQDIKYFLGQQRKRLEKASLFVCFSSVKNDPPSVFHSGGCVFYFSK